MRIEATIRDDLVSRSDVKVHHLETIEMSLPLTTIGMSVFNVEQYLSEAIESILAQTHKNCEVVLIDDASTDSTYEIACNYANDRVRVFRNSHNMGTYWSRNRALVLARGEYFTILDGDDTFHPEKVEKQIGELSSGHWACLTRYQRIGAPCEQRFGHNTLLFDIRLVRQIGFFDSVRFDGDSEYVARIRQLREIQRIREPLLNYRIRAGSLTQSAVTGTGAATPGEITRERYQANYSVWHRSTPALYLPFWQAKRRFPAGDDGQLCAREPVTASLATLPDRVDCLRETLTSILEWADHLYVFVNGAYRDVPHFLAHDRITVHFNHENIGDRAKFHSVDYVRRGYHFICDDDIIYSSTYAETMIETLERLERRAIVGVHGSVLKPGFKDYYSDDRTIHSLKYEKPVDVAVDFLGTGAIAFHAEHIQLKLEIFDRENMADVILGVHAKRAGIPLVCIKSPAALIRHIPDHSLGSIYAHTISDIPNSRYNVRGAVNDYLRQHWS